MSLTPDQLSKAADQARKHKSPVKLMPADVIDLANAVARLKADLSLAVSKLQELAHEGEDEDLVEWLSDAGWPLEVEADYAPDDLGDLDDDLSALDGKR